MDSYQASILVCTFLGVASGVFVLLALIDPYNYRIKARVDELRNTAESAQPIKGIVRADGFVSKWSTRLLHAIPFYTGDRLQLQQRLSQAGIYEMSMASVYLAVKLLMMILPLLLAAIASFIWPLRFEWIVLIGCAIGILGSVLPGLWLDGRIARRHGMLRRSLPDFLDLMIVCLEGGLSIQESIRRVGDELQLAHPELALELGIVQRDIELGASVSQALKRFAVRTHHEAVRRLASFVREAQRFGTNLSEALRLHSDMLRLQREQVAEETAQKAAVKILLPTLVLIFPAIFVVLVGPALIQIQEAFAAR